MENKKIWISWTLRFLIFGLFVFSGIAKMFPIWPFEKQLIDLGFADWSSAPYFARLIIGIELTLGIAILQPHFLKRLVIPSTILLLLVFCTHLAYQMFIYGPFNGNCGCFGQMIPMTPFEAFAKNIITIGLLVWLYRIVPTQEMKHRFSILLLLFTSSCLFMFMAFPFKPTDPNSTAGSGVSGPIVEEEPLKPDTLNATTNGQVVSTETVVPEPPKVESKFSSLNIFNINGNNTKVEINKGKRIVCFFVPGCEHCREAAKQLTELSKDPNFPRVYIYFMNEEVFLIDEFFQVAGKKYPYQVIDVIPFWNLMGNDKETPGVLYLWNGNIRKEFYGDQFSSSELKNACNLPFQ
ncbi:MAG: MauE/DoxX family redox-associated membrane protein [Bacteroidota bacterium]